MISRFLTRRRFRREWDRAARNVRVSLVRAVSHQMANGTIPVHSHEYGIVAARRLDRLVGHQGGQ